MSTVKSKKIQLGSDATASNNFTIYQPDSPDGTLRIGVGNADSPTEVARFDATGMISGGATPDALSTATGSAPSYSARAWVLFHGTGTVSVGNSGNVSSVTDAATGRYVINMTTALPAVTYAVVTNSGGTNTANRTMTETTDYTRTTTSFSVVVSDMNGGETDVDRCGVAVFI